MARKSQIHYPGALYHVILRGNAGNTVFFGVIRDTPRVIKEDGKSDNGSAREEKTTKKFRGPP